MGERRRREEGGNRIQRIKRKGIFALFVCGFPILGSRKEIIGRR